MALIQKTNPEKKKQLYCRIEESLMNKVDWYGENKGYKYQAESIRDLLYIAFKQIEGKSEIQELKELFIKETKEIKNMIKKQ